MKHIASIVAKAELKAMLESTVRLKLKLNEHAVNSAADKAMEDGRCAELGGSY